MATSRPVGTCGSSGTSSTAHACSTRPRSNGIGRGAARPPPGATYQTGVTSRLSTRTPSGLPATHCTAAGYA
eukprot:2963474-Prymnesium_polylepis.1